MIRNIVFDPSNNPAIYFSGIVKDLEEIAQVCNEPVSVVISAFIDDLKNYFNQNYERNIESVSINGISPNTLKSLITFMNKRKKEYQQRENREKKQLKTQQKQSIWDEVEKGINETILNEEHSTDKEIIERFILNIKQGQSEYELNSKEKKYVLKKLADRLDDINRKEEEEKQAKEIKKQEKEREEEESKAKIIEEKRRIEEAIEQIGIITEREYQIGNIKDKASYLSKIKDAITGKNEGIPFNVNLGEEGQEQLIRMIDEKIGIEKDELYYNQVKNFTNDFKFLKDYPEIVAALNGARNVKFTDKESYDRFSALRFLVQNGDSEYTQIDKLIRTKNINEVDRRILIARKSVMDKELENKRKIEGIR